MAIESSRLMRGLCAALLSLSAALAVAQDDARPLPHTGDAWVDASLVDIDAYAARHRDAFVDELARYQSAPRLLVEEALSAGVGAGDAYFACALAQALGRPCRELLEARQRDPATRWSAIAQALEPVQSATALQRVKRGIVDSYVRWARPRVQDTVPRRRQR